MADYRIWGRIERKPEGDYRAVASALPESPGKGPDPSDIRVHAERSLRDCQVALGRLVYDLSACLMRRGDQVVWLDVR